MRQSQPLRRFEVGVNYDLLPIPVETADPSKIEVVEVFSYGCPHCFEFEPSIEAWARPATCPTCSSGGFLLCSARIGRCWRRRSMRPRCSALPSKVNRPIFEAIHLKGLNPNDPAVLAAVFKDSAGVDGEEFLKVLNSFGVRSKV